MFTNFYANCVVCALVYIKFLSENIVCRKGFVCLRFEPYSINQFDNSLSFQQSPTTLRSPMGRQQAPM